MCEPWQRIRLANNPKIRPTDVHLENIKRRDATYITDQLQREKKQYCDFCSYKLRKMSKTTYSCGKVI